MSEDKFSLRDMTRQFLEDISQGDYEESVRHDGLLVEAKQKSKKKAKPKKKEPDYGDGAYFEGGPAADVKAREDAWAGGDNLFNAIDQAKASGSEAVTKEQEIMSITELRAMIQREMGVLSEMRESPAPGHEEWTDMVQDIYHRLMKRDNVKEDADVDKSKYAGEIIDVLRDEVYSVEGTTHATFMLYVDDMRAARVPDTHTIMRWLSHRPVGSAHDDLQHAIQAIPMSHGSDDFSYTDLRRQWEEETAR